jgi:hypothetical protein
MHMDFVITVFPPPKACSLRQCCGSGMFILDPGSDFFHPGSQIQDPRVKKAPDPGSGFAELLSGLTKDPSQKNDVKSREIFIAVNKKYSENPQNFLSLNSPIDNFSLGCSSCSFS